MHFDANDDSCDFYVSTARDEQFAVNFQIGLERRGNPVDSDPCWMAGVIAADVLTNAPPV
ncbi:DUF3558 domain-containing protein [Saccharopolyspora spinosa]|uniref:DUF3558 domain-containing protein n=1 Tax=Saccharopolyspora spinosa TaxID=60894 RepID=UPI00117A5951|nr:DUF3558 domain-containing protein [Saccharopolyspora spinosa]